MMARESIGQATGNDISGTQHMESHPGPSTGSIPQINHGQGGHNFEGLDSQTFVNPLTPPINPSDHGLGIAAVPAGNFNPQRSRVPYRLAMILAGIGGAIVGGFCLLYAIVAHLANSLNYIIAYAVMSAIFTALPVVIVWASLRWAYRPSDSVVESAEANTER